jgi:hypothetical protein
MTPLVGIAANLRTVSASHVALKFMDRGGLWPSHDVERDGLMRVAAEAADFEIEVTCIEGVAECRRRLRGSAIAELLALHEKRVTVLGTDILNRVPGVDGYRSRRAGFDYAWRARRLPVRPIDQLVHSLG